MVFVDFYTLTQPTSLTFSVPFSSQACPTSLFLPGAFYLAEFSIGTLSSVDFACFFPIIWDSVLVLPQRTLLHHLI